MLNNNELSEVNHFKASSMKDGETIRFRILPSWVEDFNEKRPFLAIVWRHYRVTQDQIDGNEGINWQDVELKVETKADPEDNPFVTDTTKDVPFKSEEDPQDPEPVSQSKGDQPKCFGMERYYDPEDKDCFKNCSYFDECTKLVKK